jgi:hypothetical protein
MALRPALTHARTSSMFFAASTRSRIVSSIDVRGRTYGRESAVPARTEIWIFMPGAGWTRRSGGIEIWINSDQPPIPYDSAAVS